MERGGREAAKEGKRKVEEVERSEGKGGRTWTVSSAVTLWHIQRVFCRPQLHARRPPERHTLEAVEEDLYGERKKSLRRSGVAEKGGRT